MSSAASTTVTRRTAGAASIAEAAGHGDHVDISDADVSEAGGCLTCPHCDAADLSLVETMTGVSSCSVALDGRIRRSGDTSLWWAEPRPGVRDGWLVIRCRSCQQEWLLVTTPGTPARLIPG